MSDLVYYAIGDVHGELGKLDLLLSYVRGDARRNATAYKIIFLGDLIDRGPDSRAVVAAAMEATAAGEAAAIKGNHEALMLNAYVNWDSTGVYYWGESGGDATIESYKRANGEARDWREAIDPEHERWLRGLPSMIRDEARHLAFVHGGIDPATFPDCTEEVRLWTRSAKFFDPGRWPRRPELERLTVVHGHTPTHDSRPHAHPRRINVDTGACFGGPLTAVVLAPGAPPRFLYAE
jgi:serine/threonine protein phosphatase 1